MQDPDISKIFEQIKSKTITIEEKSQVFYWAGACKIALGSSNIILSLGDQGNNTIQLILPFYNTKILVSELSRLIELYEGFIGQKVKSPDTFHKEFGEFVEATKKEQSKES